jgi:hypothetical protein
VAMAKELLPSKMGSKYAEVVTSCLSCLNPDNHDFGDPEEREVADGTIIGARYLENVGARASQPSIHSFLTDNLT